MGDVVSIDPDMLAVAREIYGQRQDQKFGGNRRWRQLADEYPELAEAVRPAPKNRTLSESELDEWHDARDEEERTHKHMEYWAKSQTSARRNYHYRGTRPSVHTDAKSSTPDYLRPYGCWDHSDRGRWLKSNGQGPDQTTWEDSHVEHDVRGRNLLELHVETDGGYQIENSASRDNQLEVCRSCATPLDLPRDEYGKVIRSRGGQSDYCSDRCKLDVYNARRRAARKVATHRPSFDLSTISVAGNDNTALDPGEWNRRQPRSNPASFGEVYSKPALRPWFNPPKEPKTPALHRHTLHRSIWASRHRRKPGSSSSAERYRGDRLGGPDRVARRYGTGGSPTPPTLPADWDRVTVSWRTSQ